MKRVLTFGVQMQAKKHRVHEISTFLPTLPPPDPPIRFRRVYADPQYATHAYWRRRDTIRPIRTYVRLVLTNGNADTVNYLAPIISDFSEIYRTNPNSGGILLKIATIPVDSHITQFEYTYRLSRFRPLSDTEMAG
jgi:hypothetical protein